MSTDSGVSPLEARHQARGSVGAVHYKDGQTVDRWRRTEAQVKEQRDLAQEIAEALASCLERAPEIEPGRTVGPRVYRRLEVAQHSFQRLLERDSKILAEFENYKQSERAKQAGAIGELHRLSKAPPAGQVYRRQNGDAA